MPWAVEPFRFDGSEMKGPAPVGALSIEQVDHPVSFKAEIEPSTYGHRVRLWPVELDPDAAAHLTAVLIDRVADSRARKP